MPPRNRGAVVAILGKGKVLERSQIDGQFAVVTAGEDGGQEQVENVTAEEAERLQREAGSDSGTTSEDQPGNAPDSRSGASSRGGRNR